MQLNHPTGMVEGPPDLPGETIRKTQVPVESCMQLAPSAATDFAKGVDQLAAEGIVANQLLPEVLPRFCEAHDHGPIGNQAIRASETRSLEQELLSIIPCSFAWRPSAMWLN